MASSVVQFYSKRNKDSFLRSMKKAGLKTRTIYARRPATSRVHKRDPLKKWTVYVG